MNTSDVDVITLDDSDEDDGASIACQNCGELSHGSNSAAERRTACKAWGKKCENCKKLHHLTSLCKFEPEWRSIKLDKYNKRHRGYGGGR